MVEGTSRSVVDKSRIVGVGSYERVKQAKTRFPTGKFIRTVLGGIYKLMNYIQGNYLSNK